MSYKVIRTSAVLKPLTLITAVAFLLGVFAGCTGAASSAPPVSAATSLAAPQDVVTVTYFYSPKLPPALHLANEWVATTIYDGYAAELEQGRLVFSNVMADDPGSSALVAKFGANDPSLFITTTREGVSSTSEVKVIWLYTDESLTDAKLEGQFKTALRGAIDKALGLSVSSAPVAGASSAGPSGATPTAGATSAGGQMARVDFYTSGASGPESLDLAVIPRDDNGDPVSIQGTASIKLWFCVSIFAGEKGDLLQQWDNIPLKAEAFIEGAGFMLSLPYQDYRPHSSSNGFVQVTLAVQGKTVASEVKLVQVRRILGC